MELQAKPRGTIIDFHYKIIDDTFIMTVMDKVFRDLYKKKEQILKDLSSIKSLDDRALQFTKLYGVTFQEIEDEIFLFLVIFEPVPLETIKKHYGIEGIEIIQDFLISNKITLEKDKYIISKNYRFKLEVKLV